MRLVFVKTKPQQPLTRYTGLVHMVDLLPTMLSVASRTELTPRGLDGLSLWDAVRARVPVSPRTGLVYNIDDR